MHFFTASADGRKILLYEGLQIAKNYQTFSFKPDSSGNTLKKCSNPEYPVMLRHEASATDETDASCLSMTKVVF